MEKQEKGQFNEQIRERTIKVAVEIHQMLAFLSTDRSDTPIVAAISGMVITDLGQQHFLKNCKKRIHSKANFFSIFIQRPGPKT